MSAEEPQIAPSLAGIDADTPMNDAQLSSDEAAVNGADGRQQERAAAETGTAQSVRRRPRLDLNVLGDPSGTGTSRERKHGKSMFGVLLNTLNKAKAEDKERNASEAAKKRQLTEQRLQNKLKRDADVVRQVEEAKRDKITALRREEELQLKDSVHKLKRTRTPLLANFLLTSDIIPRIDDRDDSDPKMDTDGSPKHTEEKNGAGRHDIKNAGVGFWVPPRTHPPPLYYLPAIPTPEQEAFLAKRKEQSRKLASGDWEAFKTERDTIIDQITALRKKVLEAQDSQNKGQLDTDEGAAERERKQPMATDENERGDDRCDERTRKSFRKRDADIADRDEEMVDLDDERDRERDNNRDRQQDRERDANARGASRGYADDAVEY